MHREALQAELKMIRDDLHRIVLELTERQQRVDRLHAKWDVIAVGHKGEDGEEHSQASHTLSVACFTHVCLLRLSLDTKPVMVERDLLAWSSEGRNASQCWLQRSRTGSCMHDVCTKSSTHQRFSKLSVHPAGAAHACPAAVCTCRHLSSQACPQGCQAAPQLKGAAGGHYVLDCRDCDLTGHALQAYYVIKAAQEREELQRQGDDLDARVRKAERECQGLQAALNKLMGTNLDLNASFRQASEQAPCQELPSPYWGALGC